MYQPYYSNYSYMQQPQLQPQMPPQYIQQQPQQKEERFGIISVNGEQQAKNWPIAPGSSLTFKDETSPYIYTKTMGFSQFEAPVFEKYRLIKEADPNSNQLDSVTLENFSKETQSKIDIFNKETKETFNILENEINNIHGEFNNIHSELDNIQKSYTLLKEELDNVRQTVRQPFNNSKADRNDKNKDKGES